MKNEQGGRGKPYFNNRGPKNSTSRTGPRNQSKPQTAPLPAPVMNKATNAPLEGILSVNSRGIGYFPIEGRDEDIEIETANLKSALNRDTVQIGLLPKVHGNPRQQGIVLKIVHRSKMEFVGTVETAPQGTFVIPDDRRMYMDIVLPPEESKNLKTGEKVLVKIASWDDPKTNPVGEVLKDLGKKGMHETEIQSIIAERGIDTHFPREVDDEANALAKTEHPIPAAEIARRKDVRDTLTFTIDPADAKDFDDALSFKDLGNGRFEIGIHIADVSHYVREGTALDREARKRGFSVYLVDRTIPMLPEVLSNDLCSLNPNEDKLAFSSIFVMDSNSTVTERWFGKTVINSDKRFSYEEAQNSMDTDGLYSSELKTLNLISKKLRDERYKEGAIDFDTVEIKFKLDPTGKPLEVIRKERLDTHKLIEEFMLLANREVAEHIGKLERNKQGAVPAKKPFLYRIHDVPDKDRIESLSLFVKALGYDLGKPGKDVTAFDISKLLGEIEGKSQETLIKTAAVRSMAKAIYSTRNAGHFGLAFTYYTHFTSPIRRYADLIVHRLLFKYLTNPQAAFEDFALYERIAVETSEKEVIAADAERASIKYKQVEFLKDRVGELFDGVVSGVTEWGIYVEDPLTRAEGMVRLKDIGDDFYEVDPKTYSIVGKRSGKRFSLGDKVKVKLIAADLDRRTLDFKFV